MDSREEEDELFLQQVEQLLGSKLGPGKRMQALERRRAGAQASETADWLQRREIARISLNDPDAPIDAPATRAEDDDPKNFDRKLD